MMKETMNDIYMKIDELAKTGDFNDEDLEILLNTILKNIVSEVKENES